MGAVSCNLCGADNCRVVFPAGVAQRSRIVKCNICGLMYANPRANVLDYLAAEMADPVNTEKHANEHTHHRSIKESLQIQDFGLTKRLLAELHPRRGELLEIGSGLGYLLEFFRDDGWNVRGVEPDIGLARFASKVLKLDILPGTLPKPQIPSGSLDAVLMMHVIEHVPDPLDTMIEIFRMLKPGGTLVLETPRYDSLMFKLLGRRERSVACEGHVYFFTSKTLAALAEKARFRIVRFDYVGRTLTAARLLLNLGIISKSSRTTEVLQRFADRLSLNRLTLTLNLRDMERLYLEKPSATSDSTGTVPASQLEPSPGP
jgi:2-polyprenyl-3-methyl-5-hydroxy-6-metoxy-1,4-benzoquinol methylase